MKKIEILNYMKELNLDISKYWITAGAALVMHGVKEETRDIDIGCTADMADELEKLGEKIKIDHKDGLRIIEYDEIMEAFEEWNVDKIEYIEGIPVGSLEDIKRQKKELGREKDFRDIELIDKFLENK